METWTDVNKQIEKSSHGRFRHRIWNKRPCYIYVLQCESGKWYVGTTRDRERRFIEHFGRDGGCIFTNKYKPLYIVETYKLAGDKSDQDEENIKTEAYIKKYGLDNVAGGKYVLTSVKAKIYRETACEFLACLGIKIKFTATAFALLKTEIFQ